MKNQDLSIIATVALGTATLTVLLLWSASLTAVNDAEPPAATINKPKLIARGAEFTLALTGTGTVIAGEAPVLELTAVNPAEESATAAVQLEMNAAAPSNPLSRVIAMPSVLWRHYQLLTLNPKETKTLMIPTHTRLPANRVISVAMREADSSQPPAASQPETPPQSRSRSGREHAAIIALTFATGNGATPAGLVTAASAPSSRQPAPFISGGQ